jgi:hypothetical protein
MSPQDYATAAQDQFTQADKIEAQIRPLIGMPGTSAASAVRALQAEAQQHRERGNTLLGQSDRVTTQAGAQQEQAARQQVDAFMEHLQTPKFKSPQEALGYFQNRYQQALQKLPESASKKDALEAIKAQVDEAQKAVDAITKQQLTPYQQKRLQIEANRPHRADHFGEVTPEQRRRDALDDKRFALEQKRFDVEFPNGQRPPARTSTADERDQDANDGRAAIAKNPAKRNEYIQRFASKWNLSMDKAKAYF